jgi:hypothetical protein
MKPRSARVAYSRNPGEILDACRLNVLDRHYALRFERLFQNGAYPGKLTNSRHNCLSLFYSTACHVVAQQFHGL